MSGSNPLEVFIEALTPKEVHLGMWADNVLELHPRDTMVRDPEVLGHDPETKGLIVLWYYPHFSLRLELAKKTILNKHTLEVYAVQEIIKNEETDTSDS